MTKTDKLKKREPIIRLSFAFLMLIPILAFCAAYLKVDISGITGVLNTSEATFSAILIAHFGLSPSN